MNIPTDVSLTNANAVYSGIDSLGSGAGSFIATQVSSLISDPISQLERAHKLWENKEMLLENWNKFTDLFSDDPPDLSDASPELIEVFQEIGEAFLGILDGSDWTEMAEELVDLFEGVVEGVDLGEAIGTLGISLVAGYGVKKFFEHVNKAEEETLNIQRERVAQKLKLRKMLLSGSPSLKVAETLANVESHHWKL